MAPRLKVGYIVLGCVILCGLGFLVWFREAISPSGKVYSGSGYYVEIYWNPKVEIKKMVDIKTLQPIVDDNLRSLLTTELNENLAVKLQQSGIPRGKGSVPVGLVGSKPYLVTVGQLEFNDPNPEDLMEAAMTTDVERVRTLLSSGHYVNERQVGSHSTALMCAVAAGRAEMVQLLIRSGADVNAQDAYGHTASDIAVWDGRRDILRLLVQARTSSPFQ